MKGQSKESNLLGNCHDITVITCKNTFAIKLLLKIKICLAKHPRRPIAHHKTYKDYYLSIRVVTTVEFQVRAPKHNKRCQNFLILCQSLLAVAPYNS